MAETCPKCGARFDVKPDGPLAERTYLRFGDRMLYAIAGRPGLWFLTERRTDPSPETCMANGPTGRRLFYRATEAEERIKRAMEGTT